MVRDVFNEDFSALRVSGDEAWATIEEYVEGVAPDLRDRLTHHTDDTDIFADTGIHEQIAKALDRKVWLPSGGSLVIDRTEAMTVVDVNTGKFVGSGGNLEETVTRNNLEAAEEIVRQLRLRDVGGMVVIDFIDMVLESNRDLVLRRLTECLGRDRTRHQVGEVTSLGLVQLTRKRVGQGLLEAFSEPCDKCGGQGVLVHAEPVDDEPDGQEPADGSRGRGRRGGRDNNGAGDRNGDRNNVGNSGSGNSGGDRNGGRSGRNGNGANGGSGRNNGAGNSGRDGNGAAESPADGATETARLLGVPPNIRPGLPMAAALAAADSAALHGLCGLQRLRGLRGRRAVGRHCRRGRRPAGARSRGSNG